MTESRVDSHAARSSRPDPYRWPAWGVAFIVVVTPIALMLLVRGALPEPQTSRFQEAAMRLGVSPGLLAEGRDTFATTCAACHAPEGTGVPRLGKPLRNSEFIQTHSDAEILDVILTGRPPTDPLNTTGTVMPARAGNPALEDRRLRNVVVYLRTLQDPTAPYASLDDWVVATAESGGSPQQGGAAPAGVGHAEFIASCSACHGPSGEGIEGLGKALDESPFVASKTDEELIAFIKSGRPIWDPQNTTGIDMPPKGGNPALSDEDLRKIVEYIRALHPEG